MLLVGIKLSLFIEIYTLTTRINKIRILFEDRKSNQMVLQPKFYAINIFQSQSCVLHYSVAEKILILELVQSRFISGEKKSTLEKLRFLHIFILVIFIQYIIFRRAFLEK